MNLRRQFTFVLVNVGFSLVVCSITSVAQFASGPGLDLRLSPRYQTGLNVADSTVADLDGDGNLDLAVVNSGRIGPTATATLLFGTGEGGYSTPTVLNTDAVGNAIAVGDLNNDGLPEIVVATYIENVLIVYINQGNRQFSPPVFTQDLTEANGEYFGLAIADFDGDGNNDIVGLQDQLNQRLRFFRVNPNGTLTVFSVINQYSTQSSYEGEIAIGDVNGDNRQDLVFANGGPFGPRTICFVLGQPPGVSLTLTFGFNVEDIAKGIVVKDFDNDGDRELAIAFLDSFTPTRHSVQIFRNDGGGNFVPLPKRWLEYPFPPDDLTSADFNNDGKNDLAILIGSVFHNGLMVLTLDGVGDGSFIEGKYYATAKSARIYSGDVNRDGWSDILTVSAHAVENVPGNYFSGIDNNNCSILLNESLNGFRAPLVKLWGPNFIDHGDLNEDGYLDMLSSWATQFSNPSGADVSINDRNGGFYEELSYTSPAALRDMKAGDFNGDGHVDAITAHWADNTRRLAVYFGDGSGILGSPIVFTIAQAVSRIHVADLNRDGKDDVLVIDGANGYCMISNGNGSFAIAPGSPISFTNSEFIHLADLNGDQKIDIVNTVPSGAKLWTNDGTGQFSMSELSIPPLSQIVSGDFNGDGKLDLAGTIAPPTSTLPPWRTDIAITGVLGDGIGGFSGSFNKFIPDYSNNRTASSIVSADFDLDGFDDIALAHPRNSFGNLVIVRSGGSTPSWREPMFVAADTATRSLKVADFDGNGKPDIEWLGDNSRGVIYNGWQRRLVSGLFDFDGDSKTDIGIYRPNGGSGSEWWYQRSSNGNSSAVQFGAPTDKVAAADYTGDGKTDVAFWRPSNGFWYVLRSEDLTFYAFPFGANGDVPVPSDYDADGKADVGVFRPSDSTWYVQRSGDGGTTIQQFGVNGDVPVNADYDGDGKADFAIYRPSLGQWWLMRSSAGTIAYTFGAPTDKTVVGDYTGDGKTDVAFWRPSTGEWYVLRSEDTSFFAFPFGIATDTPVPGDYDGDGKQDAGVFRSSNNTWYIQRSTAGTLIQQFGTTGDVPLPNAYVR